MTGAAVAKLCLPPPAKHPRDCKPMLLRELLKEKTIDLELAGTTKEAVLADLVNVLVAAGAIKEPEPLLQALMEREGLGSTGIGHGVAIPHGRSGELKEAALALGRSRVPVDFDSVDGEPARIFFLLVAPENGSNEHLHVLAKIARLVKDAHTRDELLRLDSPGAVAKLIGDREKR